MYFCVHVSRIRPRKASRQHFMIDHFVNVRAFWMVCRVSACDFIQNLGLCASESRIPKLSVLCSTADGLPRLRVTDNQLRKLRIALTRPRRRSVLRQAALTSLIERPVVFPWELVYPQEYRTI